MARKKRGRGGSLLKNKHPVHYLLAATLLLLLWGLAYPAFDIEPESISTPTGHAIAPIITGQVAQQVSNSNFAPIDSCGRISTSVKLTKNINYDPGKDGRFCFIITGGRDIVIDGNGFTIHSLASSKEGGVFTAVRSANLQIQNVKITGSSLSYGISVEDSGNFVSLNNDIQVTGPAGGGAIIITKGTGAIIEKNTLSTSQNGGRTLALSLSSNGKIIDNNLYAYGDNARIVDAAGTQKNSYERNNFWIHGRNTYGSYLSHVRENHLANNNYHHLEKNTDGIYLAKSTRVAPNTIEANTFTFGADNAVGIRITSAAGDTISKNTMTGLATNQRSIVLENADYAIVEDNTFTTFGDQNRGIHSSNSRNVLLEKNEVLIRGGDNAIGLEIDNTKESLITANTITSYHVATTGISLKGSEKNTFNKNAVTMETTNAIAIQGQDSTEDTFTHNSLHTKGDFFHTGPGLLDGVSSDGIVLARANGTRFTNNDITLDGEIARGIRITENAQGTKILHNTITMQNFSTGIALERGPGAVEEELIAHNSITGGGTKTGTGIHLTLLAREVVLTNNSINKVLLSLVAQNIEGLHLKNERKVGRYDIAKIPDLSITNEPYSSVKFLQEIVPLTGGASLANDIQVKRNSIAVDSTITPTLNKSALLSFNITELGITNVTPLRDGSPCPSTICDTSVDKNPNDDLFEFVVEHFSTYSVTGDPTGFVTNTGTTPVITTLTPDTSKEIIGTSIVPTVIIETPTGASIDTVSGRIRQPSGNASTFSLQKVGSTTTYEGPRYTLPLELGVYTYNIHTTDTAGKTASAQATFNGSLMGEGNGIASYLGGPDSQPEVLLVDKLTTVTAGDTEELKVQVVAGGGKSISAVTGKILLPNKSIVTQNYALAGGNIYNTSFLVPDINGEHILGLLVEDSSGNSATAEYSFTVTGGTGTNQGGGLDTTPPLVVINALAGGTTISPGDSITISATITDASGIQSTSVNITLPNGSIITKTLTHNGGDDYSTTFNDTAATGTYTIQYIAVDSEGNMDSGETKTFEVSSGGGSPPPEGNNGGSGGNNNGGSGGNNNGGSGGDNICRPLTTCGNWSTCGNDGFQTRTCTDKNNCGPDTTERRACAVCTWDCTAWTACIAGEQTRSCTNTCGASHSKPAEKQSCTLEDLIAPAITNDTAKTSRGALLATIISLVVMLALVITITYKYRREGKKMSTTGMDTKKVVPKPGINKPRAPRKPF